jgi:putative lipoic acid-binding regulatory protein
MNNTANTIVQYLQYLWKRKWLILLVTVLFAGLGYVYEKTRYQETFSGTANIFMGNANNDEWSKIRFIEPRLKELLPEKYKEKLDVSIPGDFQLQIKLNGTNSDEVKENLDKVSTYYVKKLEERFKQQESAKGNYFSKLEENIDFLEEHSVHLKQQAKKSLGDQEASDRYYKNLEFILDYYSITEDVVLLEAPELVDQTVIPVFNKPFLNPLTAAALGFQLMIVFLVLYKFFRDSLKVDRKREAKS